MYKISVYILLVLPLLGFSQTGNTGSFLPLSGGKYIVSGWVMEDYAQQRETYSSYINIHFLDSNGGLLSQQYDFTPTGEIIDGWQRIVGILDIPSNYQSNSIVIQLVCNAGSAAACYFDDIRFFPYNGNLKSFVYDADTLKLMAELDENNYATFYEYDPEGGLIRIKKETEKGVFTIQESRSSNSKE